MPMMQYPVFAAPSPMPQFQVQAPSPAPVAAPTPAPVAAPAANAFADMSKDELVKLLVSQLAKNDLEA